MTIMKKELICDAKVKMVNKLKQQGGMCLRHGVYLKFMILRELCIRGKPRKAPNIIKLSRGLLSILGLSFFRSVKV
ncbi:hypothetical protein PanWU01x14_054600 [Parasponia andersonii]|uniref:Uncharacterized protein n=1 Tax=Parasponia andersonii TaxID=3476 RepID=A0A2P5DKU7_PARAD|nr:hypothetical protein PanWU01x14_054600 [Parasponia andersonii]